MLIKIRNSKITVIFTKHAQKRSKERKFTESEIKATVLKGNTTFTTTRTGIKNKSTLNGVTVVYVEEQKNQIIITTWRGWFSDFI